MDDYTARKLTQQREEEFRRTADQPTTGAPGEPIRRRTARRLHRIARAIDVTDL